MLSFNRIKENPLEQKLGQVHTYSDQAVPIQSKFQWILFVSIKTKSATTDRSGASYIGASISLSLYRKRPCGHLLLNFNFLSNHWSDLNNSFGKSSQNPVAEIIELFSKCQFQCQVRPLCQFSRFQHKSCQAREKFDISGIELI